MDIPNHRRRLARINRPVSLGPLCQHRRTNGRAPRNPCEVGSMLERRRRNRDRRKRGRSRRLFGWNRGGSRPTCCELHLVVGFRLLWYLLCLLAWVQEEFFHRQHWNGLSSLCTPRKATSCNYFRHRVQCRLIIREISSLSTMALTPELQVHQGQLREPRDMEHTQGLQLVLGARPYREEWRVR
jgi:hypothetical protein